MNLAQHRIAIPDGVDHHPNCSEVVYFTQLFLLLGHLLPNAVQVLWPSGNIGLNAGFCQAGFQILDDLVHDFFPLLPPLPQFRHQAVIFPGVQIAKRQVFQFPLKPENPQTMSKGSIDSSLPGHFPCLAAGR